MKNLLKNLAVKNLTIGIIIGQIIVYLAIKNGVMTYQTLDLNYTDILNGEIWRVITFLFIPPTTSTVWAMISWYVLYLMGNNLENYWGESHYTLYILLAVVLTNVVSFLFSLSVGTNYYLQSSIFLAFAFLNPNFRVLIFFLIPVKIKWIAIFNAALYLWVLLTGSMGERLLLIASLTNFVIFFSKDIYFKITDRRRKVKTHIENKVAESRPIHSCFVCGKSDKTDPHTDFRYCSQCSPEQCYCEDHIQNHDHVME